MTESTLGFIALFGMAGSLRRGGRPALPTLKFPWNGGNSFGRDSRVETGSVQPAPNSPMTPSAAPSSPAGPRSANSSTPSKTRVSLRLDRR